MGRVSIVSMGLLVLLALAPLVWLVALSRHRELELAAARATRRLSRLWRRAPEPEGPPLELLAAKLRRLRLQLATTPAGASMPKERGTLAAYDDALVATARALQVPTSLEGLPTLGFDRYAERLRLEDALAQAGMVWEPRLSS